MRAATLLILSSILLVGALPYTPSRPTSPDHSNALFDLGVQVGIAERDALDGKSPELLRRRLQFIRQLVHEIGDPHLTTMFDDTIEQLDTSHNSRVVYETLLLFRQQISWQLRHSDAASSAPFLDLVLEDPVKGVTGSPRSASWEGVWETNWGTMTIVEHEDGTLTGNYGPSQHSIEGRFDPDNPTVYAGIWTHTGSTSTGRFRFEMTSENTFQGAWTSGNSPPSEVGVNWTGTRRDFRETVPDEGDDFGPEAIPDDGEIPDEPDERTSCPSE